MCISCTVCEAKKTLERGTGAGKNFDVAFSELFYLNH